MDNDSVLNSEGPGLPPQGDQPPGPQLHENKCQAKPLIIELCAGTAMLSRCFHEVGFDILAVDHSHNRFHPLAHICTLDLTEDSSWEFLEYVVRHYPVCFVHVAPPCGTCSRAREINLGPSTSQPRPLRSEQYPHGIPGLTEEENKRVDAANRIYSRMSKFLILCSQHQIHWSIENPARSLLWLTDWLQPLIALGAFYNFTACAWGSTRPTKKSFLSSLPDMCRLQASCPGNHEHEPYGRKRDAHGKLIYATAEEAAYPRELRIQIRRIVQEALNLFPEHLQADPTNVRVNAAGSIALAQQPRGKRMPPLVSEFVAFQTLETHDRPPLDHKMCLSQPWHNIPAHAKLLSSECISGDNKDDSIPTYKMRFGIYRSPKQWLDDAMQLQHPFDLYHAVPDEMLRVIFEVLTLGPAEIARRRTATLNKWIGWAKELEEDEQALKLSMEKGVEAILRPKRICLLKKIAFEMGWPDTSLFEEMVEGFNIVGLQEPSGVFNLEPRPFSFSPESLDDAAKFLRPALLGKTRASNVDEDAKRLWELTCEEATNLHWLVGPIPANDVSQRFDKPWIPVRRFGVWQSSGDKLKLRPIDDYAENRVNGAFGYSDKLDLRTLDQVVWTGAAMSRALSSGHVCFKLKSGELLEGPLHSAYTDKRSGQPLISVLDLSNAYKQFAIKPDCRRYSVVTLKNPDDGSVQCFEGRVLPFGATASVVHFNRCSRLLQHVGYLLHIPWSSYFDDFPVVSPAVLSESTMKTMTLLLDLLGFEFASHKLQQFSNQATVLGVEVDFGKVLEDKVLVGNKVGRLQEVRTLINEVIDKGSLTARECSKLLGRLQYVDSFVMGRDGRLAMTELRNHVRSDSKLVELTAEALASLRLMLDRLEHGKPRELPCAFETSPVLVFTDGASESDVNTIGGLLCVDGVFRYFACHVPSRLIEAWRTTSRHVIAMVELYGVVVARHVWKDHLSGRKAIAFVDNESAKEALVKGSSLNVHFRNLLLRIEKAEKESRSWMWISRVPSASNPGDGPSRGDVTFVEALGAVRDQCMCPLLDVALQDL